MVKWNCLLTAKPMFLTNFDSAILAKGRSAPQHSTYLVIFDEGRLRVTWPREKGHRKQDGNEESQLGKVQIK